MKKYKCKKVREAPVYMVKIVLNDGRTFNDVFLDCKEARLFAVRFMHNAEVAEVTYISSTFKSKKG